MKLLKFSFALIALLALSTTNVYAAETKQPESPGAATAAKAKDSTKAEQKKAETPKSNPVVVMSTTLGDMTIELDINNAPVTVRNFLSYVDSGYYEGIIFHRVIPGFVVQGGGFDLQYRRKSTNAPIANESDNGLKNLRGTLSMARTADPNSATSQFFISLNDNPNLDWQNNRPGYAVFGKVTKGIEVIDKMALLPQGMQTGVFANAPNDRVIIKSVTRVSKGDKK